MYIKIEKDMFTIFKDYRVNSSGIQKIEKYRNEKKFLKDFKKYPEFISLLLNYIINKNVKNVKLDEKFIKQHSNSIFRYFLDTMYKTTEFSFPVKILEHKDIYNLIEKRIVKDKEYTKVKKILGKKEKTVKADYSSILIPIVTSEVNNVLNETRIRKQIYIAKLRRGPNVIVRPYLTKYIYDSSNDLIFDISEMDIDFKTILSDNKTAGALKYDIYISSDYSKRFRNLFTKYKHLKFIRFVSRPTNITFLSNSELKNFIERIFIDEPSELLIQRVLEAISLEKNYIKYFNDYTKFDLEYLKQIFENYLNRYIDVNLNKFVKKLETIKSCKKIDKNEIQKLSKTSFNASLFEHQQLGYSWLTCLYKHEIPGAILADDMGLGKTIQIIAFLSQMKNKKIVIVAPASVVGSWENEIKKFNEKLFTDNDIKILSYEKLLNSKIDKVDIIILDEAQKVKNKDTQMWLKIDTIKRDFTLIVTGTPIENKIEDIINLLTLISRDFIELRMFSKLKLENDLKLKKIANTIAPIYLQRKKTDLKDLNMNSELELIEDVIEASALELKLYELIKKHYSEELEKLKKVTTNQFYQNNIYFTVLLRFRQVVSYPQQLPDYLLEKLPSKMQAELKNFIPSKAKETLKIIKEKNKLNEKVIIFTMFNETTKFLKKYLSSNGYSKVLIIDGSIKSTLRTEIVKKFQEDPEYKIIIIALKAGNAGITLTSANNVILYDLWYNPQVIAQAFARAHRIGQQKDVSAYFLILKNTFDEIIMKIIKSKINLIKNFEDKVNNTSSNFNDNENDVKKEVEKILKSVV